MLGFFPSICKQQLRRKAEIGNKSDIEVRPRSIHMTLYQSCGKGRTGVPFASSHEQVSGLAFLKAADDSILGMRRGFRMIHNPLSNVGGKLNETEASSSMLQSGHPGHLTNPEEWLCGLCAFTR